MRLALAQAVDRVCCEKNSIRDGRCGVRMFAVAALVWFLSGCAALKTNEGLEAYNRGDCASARALWMEAANSGDGMAINNLGAASENCDGDAIRAAQWYTLAARMGVPIARANLARLGLPIPAADLQRQSGYDPVAAALAIQLLQGNRAASPPRSINCTTTHYARQSVTECR
jgi:TPR repeat protein